jgi:hypothetical protein
MPMQQGRSGYEPFAIPLHLTSTSKGNTQEGNNETWKLTNKQTRPNNQTSEIISEIHEFNRI